MIVDFPSVKVGHRQALIPQNPSTHMCWGFVFAEPKIQRPRKTARDTAAAHRYATRRRDTATPGYYEQPFAAIVLLCAVRLPKSIRWSCYRERPPDSPDQHVARPTHAYPRRLRPVRPGLPDRRVPWHRHAGGRRADVRQARRHRRHDVRSALGLVVAHLLVGVAMAGRQPNCDAGVYRLDRSGSDRGMGV